MHEDIINNLEKLAQFTVDPEYTASVDFAVGDKAIHADILGEEEGFAPTADSVFAVQEAKDADGNVTRQFLRISRKLVETKTVVVEFLEDHESTIKKGGTAVAVISGVIAVGSLYAKRIKKLNP